MDAVLIYNNGSILVLYYDSSVDGLFADGILNIAAAHVWSRCAHTISGLCVEQIDYIAGVTTDRLRVYTKTKNLFRFLCNQAGTGLGFCRQKPVSATREV